ncbi:phosphatidylserine decarboxylase [Massilia sp. S19_KUP03_FR1]|uniref:phosphatidylserine decarboxylase n=1 Tax=Massilia sp. S19_KUP03_FR1 TaxID=3025503 RepID=UPI002FCD7FFC
MHDKPYHPVVAALVELIGENSWAPRFQRAIDAAHSKHIPQIADIKDLADYLDWIDAFLRWVPCENAPGREVYVRLCKFYFILDQEPLLTLQNRVVPEDQSPPLTPLSAWLVMYAKAMGEFLDQPESLTPASLQSFRDSPTYNLDDYIEPHGGWKSFNQFFARNYKPGYRPVAAIMDPSVIVSPADATFAGQWENRSNSKITVKGLHWSVEELLEGSPYKDRFKGGQFMHAFLGPNDYHRQHAPVGGRVLEARVIPGQVYLEVEAVPVPGAADGAHHLQPVRTFDAPDNAGYQFSQARGLVVMQTPIGLVAILPIGMCQVSSVILTAEVGVTLRKGEEISYFQFGGSDIIVLFEAASNVSFTAQPGTHYKQGSKIAQAYPVQ